jgi:hypothetical protein
LGLEKSVKPSTVHVNVNFELIFWHTFFDPEFFNENSHPNI